MNASIEYEKILKNIDIKDELEKRGYKSNIRSGINLMICCPFHDEKTPSFGIALEGQKKGLYRCLGCEQAGNFFHFVSKIDNVDYKTALKKYTKKDFDISDLEELEIYLYEKLKKKKENNSIKIYDKSMLDGFKKPYGEFLKYLIKERHLTKETIKKFNILCDDNDYLGWKDRIIIPILDIDGDLTGITARYIKKCDRKNKVRKIKGSDVSKVLYGAKWLKKENKKIYIVEGEIDMIYLQQNGIPAVTTGKNPSEQQISQLVKIADEIVISLDGDVGLEYILKLKNKLSKYIPTSILILPEDRDPNELTPDEIKSLYREENCVI